MKFWMPHMHGQGSMQAARDLRVAVTKGVKEGRNKRWKETQDSLIGMGEAGIDAAIEDIASQDVGQKLIAEKRTKVAQEQRGLDYTEVETALKETEAAMEEQGDFQQAFSWDAIRSKLIVNTPVLGPAQGYEQRPGRTQAESLRIQEETINTLMFRAFQADDAAMRREWEDYRSSRRTGPDEMKRLIEIAKSHHDIAASAARPPLSAPPPTPAQRD
jgi:hypothetical protein